MKIFTVLKLLSISLFAKIVASLRRLPGNYIDSWIRLWSIRHLKQLGMARAFQLFVNPISSIRYFEFDFVLRNMETTNSLCILDVSSPRGFALYLCKRNPMISYTMMNPDPLDVQETRIQIRAFDLKNLKVVSGNALSLSFKDKSFDRIVSISVIEHIEKDGDSKAMKEMWRVLVPGGKLIITTHIAKEARTEYREIDQYNLAKKRHNKYFFQRIYSNKTLEKRILKYVPVKPKVFELFGEIEEGWFDEYIARWIRWDLRETVWDPWYMVKKFSRFESINELPGVGVLCLVFEKTI